MKNEPDAPITVPETEAWLHVVDQLSFTDIKIITMHAFEERNDIVLHGEVDSLSNKESITEVVAKNFINFNISNKMKISL